MPIVYGMTCKDPTKIYFGSTMTTKEIRFAKHKCSWIRWKDGKDHYRDSFELFEIGDVEIHIIMDIADDISKFELRQIEQIFLDNCECINKKRAYSTEEDRIQYLKNYYKEYRKPNKLNNKDIIS